MRTTPNANRSKEGKYAHRDDRMCRCGHSYGEHTAVRIVAARDQPCTVPECYCTYFTAVRR